MAHYLIAVIGVVALLMATMACGDNNASEFGDSLFPIVVTDERVDLGQSVYEANCASCHGKIGDQPPVIAAPSHAEDGHTWHHADRHLYQWILDGPPLSTIMPGFRDVISEDEVIAVLAYIKSGWPVDIQTMQNENSRRVEVQLVEDAIGN